LFAKGRRALTAVKELGGLISRPYMTYDIISRDNVTTRNNKEVVRKSRYS